MDVLADEQVTVTASESLRMPMPALSARILVGPEGGSSIAP